MTEYINWTLQFHEKTKILPVSQDKFSKMTSWRFQASFSIIILAKVPAFCLNFIEGLVDGIFFPLSMLYRVHLTNKSGWVSIILESISIPLKNKFRTIRTLSGIFEQFQVSLLIGTNSNQGHRQLCLHTEKQVWNN